MKKPGWDKPTRTPVRKEWPELSAEDWRAHHGSAVKELKESGHLLMSAESHLDTAQEKVDAAQARLERALAHLKGLTRGLQPLGLLRQVGWAFHDVQRGGLSSASQDRSLIGGAVLAAERERAKAGEVKEK